MRIFHGIVTNVTTVRQIRDFFAVIKEFTKEYLAILVTNVVTRSFSTLSGLDTIEKIGAKYFNVGNNCQDRQYVSS